MTHPTTPQTTTYVGYRPAEDIARDLMKFPTTRVPQCRFRLKGTTLQQAFTSTSFGPVFWVDVPSVPEDASDVG